MVRCSSGRSPTCSIGFGVFSVSGRRRLPYPPAMMTADSGARSSLTSRRSTRPSTVPVASTTTRLLTKLPRALSMAASTSAASADGPMVSGARFAISPQWRSRGAPARMARRMSPSLTTPRSDPASSAMISTPEPARSSCAMAAPIVVVGATRTPGSRSAAMGNIGLTPSWIRARPAGGARRRDSGRHWRRAASRSAMRERPPAPPRPRLPRAGSSSPRS